MNLLSKLYPVTSLVCAVSIALIGIMSKDYIVGYVVVLPLLLVLSFLDGKLISYSKKMYKIIVFLAVTIFLIQALFNPSDEIMFSIWVLNFKTAGVHEALSLISIIICIAGSILLLFEIVDLEDFMVSLVKLKMPYTLAYVFLATLQMIPDFSKRSKTIMEAQQSRGIETEGRLITRVKAFIPMLSPLVISSITEIEDKVITLESRSFSSTNKRIFLVEKDMENYDYIITGIALILLVCFIIWRFAI